MDTKKTETAEIEFLRKEVSRLQEELGVIKNKHIIAKSVVENTQDLITIHDKKGIVFYETPSVARELGYSLLNRHPFEFVHPHDFKKQMKAFLSAFRDGVINEPFQFRCKTADGGFLLLESVATELIIS
jgi:PAS domain S-box-containing protein